MKRYILSLMGIVGVAFVAGAAEEADTVIAVEAPSRVIISESQAGLNVTVVEGDTAYFYGRDYMPDARISTTQRWGGDTGSPLSTPVGGRDDLSIGGFNFGFIHPSGAREWGIETGKSFEMTIENILAYRRMVPMGGDWRGYLSVGVGCNWRFYTLSRDTRFLVDDAGDVGLSPYPEGVHHRSSAIRTFSLQLPVTWTQQFPGKMFGSRPALTLGAILNWNTNACVTSSWDDAAGNKVDATQRGLHQQRFTVDVIAKLRVCPVASLYVRYSPMSIFKNGHGPEVQPLTFGISLF